MTLVLGCQHMDSDLDTTCPWDQDDLMSGVDVEDLDAECRAPWRRVHAERAEGLADGRFVPKLAAPEQVAHAAMIPAKGAQRGALALASCGPNALS